jgi:hypothetical protein
MAFYREFQMTIEPIAETVDDFRKAIPIGRTRFYKDVKAGLIKVVKCGRKTLVPISERQA